MRRSNKVMPEVVVHLAPSPSELPPESWVEESMDDPDKSDGSAEGSRARDGSVYG